MVIVDKLESSIAYREDDLLREAQELMVRSAASSYVRELYWLKGPGRVEEIKGETLIVRA